MPTLTPQQFVKKFQALSACKEAVDWVGSAGHPDFSAAWRACEFPQWMAWLAARMAGLEGARGALACARTVSKHADPKLTEPALDLALKIVEGKSADRDKLLALAFDCADAALHPKVANGPALMAASFAAHLVAGLMKANALPEGKDKHKALIKACGHAADCVGHVMDAAPEQKHKLTELVRASVSEAALVRVWDKIPL
jgi:hypothetical protein